MTQCDFTENSLSMRFMPVAITGGPTDGKTVLFSIWQTRMKDYAAYAAAKWRVKKEWKQVLFDLEDNHPVVNVRWSDAKSFCAWLTKKERSEKRIGAADTYRLPTDHEWSCAVGIGDREDPERRPFSKECELLNTFPWGDQWPPPEGAGNFSGEESTNVDLSGFDRKRDVIKGYSDPFPFTSPVGYFTPSKDGLYDLSGNVWEYCEDIYLDYSHVIRGGSWTAYDPKGLFSNTRQSEPVDGSGNRAKGGWSSVVGFRVVLEFSGDY